VEAPLAGNGGHGDRLRSTQVSRGKGESECERELGLDEAGEQGSSLASPSDTRRRGGERAQHRGATRREQSVTVGLAASADQEGKKSNTTSNIQLKLNFSSHHIT